MSKDFKTYSWFKRYTKDLSIRKTRTQDYRTNSVVALKNINDKYRLIEKSSTILDLGASPGGWSQYVLEVKKRTSSGTYKVVAIDKLQMESISGVYVINGDFTDCNFQTRLEVEMGMGLTIKSSKFNLILADVCSSVPRARCVDKAGLESLLAFTSRFLSKKGMLLYRFFPQYREAISELFKRYFKFLIFERSETSRVGSSEMFVVCSS